MIFAAEMNHLEVLKELVQVISDRLVDSHGPLASAHDHDDGLISRKAAEGEAFIPVAGKQLVPDRGAGKDGFAGGKGLYGFGEVAADFCGGSEAEFVGKARGHVGLMNDAGDLQGVGGPDHGNADKASLGEDHVGMQLFQSPPGFEKAVYDPEGIGEVLQVKVAAELSCGNARIGDLIILDQLLFDTVFGTDVVDIVAGLLQIGKERYIGSHVACGPAAGQYDLFLCHK